MLQEMKYLRERNKLLEQKLKTQNFSKETDKNKSTQNKPKITNQETKSFKIVIDRQNSSIITDKST